MGIEIEYNPDTRGEFLDPVFKKFPQLAHQLKTDFIYCKSRNMTNSLFGHDAIFTFPDSAVKANLSRFHIKLPDDVSWPANCYDREKKSDTYLVYAQHIWNSNSYSIMAVLRPAHSRITSLISYFARCAEDFSAKR